MAGPLTTRIQQVKIREEEERAVREGRVTQRQRDASKALGAEVERRRRERGPQKESGQ